MKAGGRTILLVADALTATQQIAFLRPIGACGDERGLSLKVEHNSDRWQDAAYRDAVWEACTPDIVILSRCVTEAAGAWIERARRAQIPVVYHIDDDLLDVPLSIGRKKYDFYRDPRRLAAVRMLIDASDLLCTSTAALEKVMGAHDLKPPVMHGPLSCSAAANQLEQPLPSTMPTLGYMATGGHNADIEAMLPVIEQLMTDIPLLQFETFGSVESPAGLQRFGARVRHHPPVKDYDAFLARLTGLGWWLGIAPLVDTRFNQCKSDIKWLEYTLSGIATAVSASCVYERPIAKGATLAANCDKDWYDNISGLLVDHSARGRQISAARALVERCYGHAAMLDQIEALVDRALGIKDQSKTLRTERDHDRVILS